MKNIGIFYNPLNHKNKDFLNQKISFLGKKNFTVFLLKTQASQDLQNVEYVEKFSCNLIDMLLVFGGDGTMLLAAKLVLEENLPILGFNLGKLGFLSECNKNEFELVISNIIQNNFSEEHRLVLSCHLGNQSQQKFYAINDCAIYKSKYPKLINVDIYKDELPVYSIRADGAIAATPTGSTAYSLSAGGSIIFPESDVITITPINPHNPFLKPIIFPAKSKICFTLKSEVKGVYLNIDGVNKHEISFNDKIHIEKAEFTTKFLRLSDKDFCKILREKFAFQKKI